MVTYSPEKEPFNRDIGPSRKNAREAMRVPQHEQPPDLLLGKYNVQDAPTRLMFADKLDEKFTPGSDLVRLQMEYAAVPFEQKDAILDRMQQWIDAHPEEDVDNLHAQGLLDVFHLLTFRSRILQPSSEHYTRPNIDWETVHKSITQNPEFLTSIILMEEHGHEPDVIYENGTSLHIASCCRDAPPLKKLCL